MPTLSLTVTGPFAFVEGHPLPDSVTLMAPMCPQHTGGISTIDKNGEVAFQSPTEYELNIGFAHPGPVPPANWPSGHPVLVCPKPKTLKASDWRFWLKLPKPDGYVPVRPEAMRISHQPPTSSFAVGIRFIYKCWDGGNVMLRGGGSSKTFNFAGLGENGPNNVPAHGDMEVGYEGPLRDDLDHEDAKNCFSTLMKHLGLDWSVDFSPELGTQATQRHDCRAAVAWVK